MGNGAALGILGRAAAGGFKAVEENADTRIKSNLEEKKATALAKKNENLLRLQQAFQTKEREEGQNFESSQGSSGMYKDGREITKEELSRLNDEDRKGLLSSQSYQEGVESKEAKAGELKHSRALEIAGLKKKETSGDKKYSKEQSLSSLSAKLNSKGVPFDVDSMTVIVETDANGNPKDMSVLSELDQSGFEFNSGKVEKEDKPYWFTGDTNYVTYHLGAYNPDRVIERGQEEPKSNLADLVARVNNLSGGDAPKDTDVPTKPEEPKQGILSQPETADIPQSAKQMIEQYQKRTGKQVPGKVAEEVAKILQGMGEIDYSQGKTTNYLRP